MKVSIKLLCSIIILASLVVSSQAQETNQMYVVHEDLVFPNKIAEYEAATKAFSETMKEHNATDAAYLTVSLDDMRYLFVSPIENYGSLDKNSFETAIEAMGQDGFDNLMSKYDGTFSTHKNYVISLSQDLSYKSDQIVVEGVNYRHFEYFFINPDKWDEAKAISKEWKELHTAKNAPNGYRSYSGGLGTEPMFMIVRWAKNAAEFQANMLENQEALGDYSDLWNRTMELTIRKESYDGMIRPELSFMPETAMADQ
jgi:hypothetical protein